MSRSTAPPRAAAAPEVATCLNCGARIRGAYCADCGQHRPASRFTLTLLFAGLAEQLALERGLLRTAREMSVRPGATIRAYVQGQRRRYTGPFTYFFAGAAVSLVTFALYRDRLAGFIEAHGAPAASGEHPLFSPTQGVAFRELLLEVSQQPAYRGLVMCVPFALLLRLLFGRRRLGLAEALAFSLFVFGHAYLLHSVFITPVFYLVPRLDGWLWVGVVPYLVVAVHAASGYFDRPLGAAVRAGLALLLSFAFFALVLGLSATAYVLLRVP